MTGFRHLISEHIQADPHALDEDIAQLVYNRITKADLMPLLVDEVRLIRRAGTRHAERSAVSVGPKPLSNRATLDLGIPQALDSHQRMQELLRRSWRIDGLDVEIGEATREQIQSRIIALKKMRSGLDRTIGVLEAIDAELSRTGARCLNELHQGGQAA